MLRYDLIKRKKGGIQCEQLGPDWCPAVLLFVTAHDLDIRE